MPRDVSRLEYFKRMKAHGFVWCDGVMGYWQLPNSTVHVSEWNAPRDTNRSRLAYMIAQADKDKAARGAAK